MCDNCIPDSPASSGRRTAAESATPASNPLTPAERLHERLRKAVQIERRAIREIALGLAEMNRTQLYKELGFAGLAEYGEQAFGFSSRKTQQLALLGACWDEPTIDDDMDDDGYPAGDDCDDFDASVHPGAEETCNERDDDCDGLTDDQDDDVADASTWYEDEDHDAFGDESASMAACQQPWGYAGQAGDCDDQDPELNPLADEVCSDGLDNDCDGATDEDDCLARPYLGDLTLTADYVVDCFCSDYDRVYGSLTVTGEGVTDPDGLDCLVEVTGDLTITQTGLEALELQRLTTVLGSLALQDNEALAQASLPALASVTLDLDVSENALLDSLDLSGLDEVGQELAFSGNTSLSTLELDALADVGSLSVQRNDLSGGLALSSLERTADSLRIANNQGLAAIDLPSLAQVDQLTFQGNPLLSSLELPALATASDIEISTSPILASLDLLSLISLPGDLTISSTGLAHLDGLAYLETVEGDLTIASCDVVEAIDLPSLVSVGDLRIQSNAALASLAPRRWSRLPTFG